MPENQPDAETKRCRTCGLPDGPDYGDPHTCPPGFTEVQVNSIEIHPPPDAPPVVNPCHIGRHRWAWLTDGRQACGYCGTPR